MQQPVQTSPQSLPVEQGFSDYPGTCVNASSLARGLGSTVTAQDGPGPDEDITISFSPKLPLAQGESVRLAMPEFRGRTTRSVRVTSTPQDAVVTAAWSSESKELLLVIGQIIPAHSRVKLVVHAECGVCRNDAPSASNSLSSSPLSSKALTTTSSQILDGSSVPNEIAAPVISMNDLAQHSASPAVKESIEPLSSATERKRRAAARRAEFLEAQQREQGHSEEMRPSAGEQLAQLQAQGAVGLGLALSACTDPLGARVTALEEGGAGWQSGQLEEGDVVIAADGVQLGSMGPDALACAMLGPPLSVVELSVLRTSRVTGKFETREVVITRSGVSESSLDRNAGNSAVAESLNESLCFDEIPEAKPESLPEAGPAPVCDGSQMTQAEWARKMLASKPDITKRTVIDKDAIAAQARGAKHELDNRPVFEAETKFDAAAVADQAKWAKESLENREEKKAEKIFDAAAVADQAKWAKESLENREEKKAEKIFDAAAVADQAKWAKESLENREEKKVEKAFDPFSVKLQALWAKERLDKEVHGNIVDEADGSEHLRATAYSREAEKPEPDAVVKKLADTPESVPHALAGYSQLATGIVGDA